MANYIVESISKTAIIYKLIVFTESLLLLTEKIHALI